MRRQPVCRGYSRIASSTNLAASWGKCWSVADAACCVRDALWKMMCASMCWCPGFLLVRSIFLCGSLPCFFPPQTGPSLYIINEVIMSLSLFLPQAKIRFQILTARSLCLGHLIVHWGATFFPSASDFLSRI